MGYSNVKKHDHNKNNDITSENLPPPLKLSFDQSVMYVYSGLV